MEEDIKKDNKIIILKIELRLHKTHNCLTVKHEVFKSHKKKSGPMMYNNIDIGNSNLN